MGTIKKLLLTVANVIRPEVLGLSASRVNRELKNIPNETPEVGLFKTNPRRTLQMKRKGRIVPHLEIRPRCRE
jgi:hypothetical protein